MQESSLPSFSVPLISALEGLDGWLRRENAVRVIAATPRMSELRKNVLPSHVQVISRPLKGRRIITRSARYFKQTRLKIADYPEAKRDEWALPVLLCVIRGAAMINAGDYALQCQPGDFVLIPPMVPKGGSASDNPQQICDVLHIYPGRLLGEGLECWVARSQGERVEGSDQLGAALLKDVFLASLFERLCEEIKRAPRGEIVLFLMRSFLLLLRHELKEGRALRHHGKHVSPPGEQMRDPIKHALAYIESHLDEPLTIHRMARETALSATNFNLLFQRTTGCSFRQHLITSRLELAKTLLRETDLKVQDVAGRTGLSPSRLHRLFVTKFSCSPGEYRKQK
jgi:AraC-like DNA-binding protein